MIKLVVFDWDDVFSFGATKGYIACYHRMLQELGVQLSQDEELRRIKKNWGGTSRSEIQGLLMERPELVDQGVELYENILRGDTFVGPLRFVDGGHELLDRLAKNYKLAIASGVNPTVLKEKIFPKFKIRNVFSEIITVYDLRDHAHAKPHPYMLLEIMKRLGVAPSETVMVGDAANDMQMAESAGVTPVAVLTGHLTKKEAQGMGISHILADVTELPTVLSKMG